VAVDVEVEGYLFRLRTLVPTLPQCWNLKTMVLAGALAVE